MSFEVRALRTLACAGAALAGIALAGSVGAGSAAAANRGLDFHRCGRDGHEAFQCARMTVPLKLAAGRPRASDRGGRSGHRRIRIHVERLRSTRHEDGVLLALAGGPGQAASDFAPQFAEQLAPAYAGSEQLVVIDQRGTGKSGFLDCGDLEGPGHSTAPARRCSRKLGARARWYRTADSVADIQKLRYKLGAKRLSIYGVSYGTVVAGQYARTYPNRVRSLILDSVFSGWDPLLRPSFAASTRVLDAFCAAGACDGITSDPVGDTAALVQRTHSGVEAAVVDPSQGFDRVRKPIKSSGLFATLMGTDLNPALRSLWPGALAAAKQGDLGPAGRLVQLAGAGAARADEGRELSIALNLATNCTDTPNPWTTRTPIPSRKQAAGELADATPAATFGPFDAGTAYGAGIVMNCFGWRQGPQPAALTDRPLPDVPALLLEGEVDVRTPISTMEAVRSGLPRSESTIISNQGHSALGTPCGLRSLAAWSAGDPVAARCEQPLAYRNQAIPPRSLDDYQEPTRPERTFEAAQETLFDDALVIADVLSLGGQQRGGGLRAGGIEVRTKADGTVVIPLVKGYSLVPGVRLTGRMKIADGSLDGRIDVRGRAASHGTLKLAGGELSGTLGDEHFNRGLSADERRAVRAVAEAKPVPAAIP